MYRFLKAQAVVRSQVFGKEASKRTVAHNYLHPSQHRVGGGDFVPEGDSGGRVRDVSRQHPAGQYVTQRINQHQALTPFDQLAGIEPIGRPGGCRRVFHALRVNNDVGGLHFLGVFTRQSAFRQAFNSSNVPSRCHLAKYQYTMSQGGKSPGRLRHRQPFFSTYSTALTTATSDHLLRRRIRSSGSSRCQSRA